MIPSRLSQADLQKMFDAADASGQKLDRAELVQSLVDKGVQIEGLNEPKQKKVGLFEKLKQRNQAAFGTDSGFLSAAKNPSQIQPSATQRLLTGQQGFGSTALQIAGQGAGAIGDLAGAALGAGGKVLSALTPDAIEKPVIDAAKSAGAAVMGSPAGQAAAGAIGKGAELYGQFKEANPVPAANLEAAGNIASLIPVGRVSQAGKQALSGVDDAAKGAAKGIRESAEASVSRVLNPTTNATKATTQKLAGELVDRPMSETLSLTRKGMQQKAGAAKEVAGEAIEQAGPLQGTTRTGELINYLESQKQAFTAGGKVVSKEGVQSVDEVIRILSQYGEEVDDEVLRSVRKIFDSEFYQGKKNVAKSVAETSTLEMKHRAADKIRGILAEAHPDIARLNKEYTFWSGLDDVLSKTTTRKTGQKQALKAIATIGGATTGNTVVGKVLGGIGFNLVASLIDSPAWGFVSAKAKNKIATALASKDISELGKILGSLPGLTAAQAVPDSE